MRPRSTLRLNRSGQQGEGCPISKQYHIKSLHFVTNVRQF
jgi:hypothetical protein